METILTVITVSYTHLDVYKRQILNGIYEMHNTFDGSVRCALVRRIKHDEGSERMNEKPLLEYQIVGYRIFQGLVQAEIVMQTKSYIFLWFQRQDWWVNFDKTAFKEKRKTLDYRENCFHIYLWEKWSFIYANINCIHFPTSCFFNNSLNKK